MIDWWWNHLTDIQLFISSLLSWLMPISVKVQKNKINKIKSKNNHGKFRNILFVNGFPFALLTAGTRTGAKKRNDKISSIILVWTGKKYSVNITSHYFNNKTFLWSLIYKKIYHIILYHININQAITLFLLPHDLLIK